MPIATGVNKVLTMKKETTWGVLAGAASGQIMGRITSDLSLQKETYASEEIVSHQQQADLRHGVRSVRGSMRGEPAPGALQLPLAAALRRLFTSITAMTAMSITVAGAGPTYTITRAAGDWMASGAKIGTVFRLTAGTFNAANLNKNLVILALTATVATVVPLNGVALFAEGPIAGATATFSGMISYVPGTGHTDESFTIEHWHGDISQSEQFVGCKVSQLSVNLPPTGMSNYEAQFFGKDMSTGVSQYFVTTPIAASTAGKLAAINGALMLAGTPVALLTGLNFTINGNMTSEPVVGSNTYPEIFEGRVLVEGQMTVMFQDAVARDYFINESEVSLVGAFATGSAANADFMSFAFPRLKFKSATKDDGEKAVIQTMAFDALYNSAGGASSASHQTSVMVHDSLAA
jgi:hypothetical protein